MPLDPAMKEILDFIASRGLPPHYELEPAQAREVMERSREVFGGEPVSLPRIEDLAIPGPGGEILIRIYAPERAGPLPVLVFYHGGGWVMGSLESHDYACRALAQEAGCMIVAVDYRLAPEHKFPAPVDDALAALRWVHGHAAELGGDPARLAVGGDSAGGNLSAVVAQLARDGGGPPLAFQLLIYPVVTHDFDTASMHANAEGYLLTVKGMHWFWGHYLNDPAEANDPRAAPALAASLAGLPPALVVTAEFDPLCDEGQAYCRALQAAGVKADLAHYDGLIHGFLTMTKTERTRAAIAEMGAALGKALG